MSFALFSLPDIERLISRMSIPVYQELVKKHPEYIKTELIEGVVLQKMTKSPEHRYFTQKVASLLDLIRPKNSTLMIESPITFAHSELEPDVSIITGSSEDYRFQHPSSALLIVEVANSSLAYDRQKGIIYAKANIPEYWILDCDSLQIEVYSSPENGEYKENKIYQKTDTVSVFENLLDLNILFS